MKKSLLTTSTLLLGVVGFGLAPGDSHARPEFVAPVNAACQSFNGTTPPAPPPGCTLCHTDMVNFTQRKDPEWSYWEKQALTLYCSSIFLRIEEPSPTPGDVYTGVANVRGFAVTKEPHEITELRWSVDGQDQGLIPYGGGRQDVATFFGSALNLHDPVNSGYGLSLNYSLLTEGSHTITLRPTASNGDTGSVTVTFNTTRFNFPGFFLSDPARINLSEATLSVVSGSTIRINNVVADGQRYSVDLAWRTATQDWDLTRIDPAGGGGPVNMAGSWHVDEAFASENCLFAEPTDFAPDGIDVLVLTQNGQALSGTSSGGKLSVSGSIAENGDYQLASPAQVNTLEGGCQQTVVQSHTGNLFAGTLTTVTSSTFSGTCPSAFTACQVVYEGALTRASAASMQSADFLHDALLKTLQGLTR